MPIKESKKKFSYIFLAGLAVAALFLLPNKEFLKENNLLLGLKFNDHIAVGTLGLIAAAAALYKLILLSIKK